MKIIVLHGPSGVGKTETIKLTDQILQNNLGAPLVAGDIDTSYIVNGKRLRLFSMGDFAKIIIQVVRESATLNIDVLIIACNDRFKTPAKEFAKWNTLFVSKTKQNNKSLRRQENINDANIIISMI